MNASKCIVRGTKAFHIKEKTKKKKAKKKMKSTEADRETKPALLKLRRNNE